MCLACLVCYAFKDRPVRFGLALGGLCLSRRDVHQQLRPGAVSGRNYFGVLRVTYDASGNFNRLIHGHTLHGQQSLDPDRRLEPLTYYHRTGPIGQVFEVLHSVRDPGTDVALVGLGAGITGSVCRARPAHDYYEIDPVVAKISRRTRVSSHFSKTVERPHRRGPGRCPAAAQRCAEHAYGLIVLDAFSSDAIPTHLLTREALRLYCTKLGKNGILAFHISNKCIDLAPILGALARDAGLHCLVRRDLDLPASELLTGKEASTWAVMAATQADLGSLSHDPRWVSPPVSPAKPFWTDDLSIIEHLRLN